MRGLLRGEVWLIEIDVMVAQRDSVVGCVNVGSLLEKQTKQQNLQ